MAVEAIAAIGAAMEAAGSAGTQATPASGLYSMVADHLESTNERIQIADHGVRQLATGEADDLHRVMLDLEKAKLSLSLVVQVRNRLLESYQDVMRMQL